MEYTCFVCGKNRQFGVKHECGVPAPKPAPAADPQTDAEKYDDLKCLACGENYDTSQCPSCFPAQQSASSAQGEESAEDRCFLAMIRKRDAQLTQLRAENELAAVACKAVSDEIRQLRSDLALAREAIDRYESSFLRLSAKYPKELQQNDWELADRRNFAKNALADIVDVKARLTTKEGNP